MLDIIIKNGRVIDPANNVDRVADVALCDGRIAGVGDYQGQEADRVLDAKGHLVVPGLIDFHIHAYPLTKMGISVETACLTGGVTTAVDAGSAGWANYETLRGFTTGCKVRIKSYVNVSPVGIAANNFTENVDPGHLGGVHRRELRRIFRSGYPELVGLKLRVCKKVIGGMGAKPLDEALKLAGEIGVPLVVHAAEPAVPMAEICDKLRKGDVLTHMYHNQGESILDADGHVIPEALRARERGVLFALGHAPGHCSIDVARLAIGQDFLPDVIGTDACEEGMFREDLMYSMPFVLSKLLALGLKMRQIVERCTANPARVLGMAGKIGSLSRGAAGDVAVFALKDREMRFKDRHGDTAMAGNKLLKPVATVKDGQVVFRDLEF